MIVLLFTIFISLSAQATDGFDAVQSSGDFQVPSTGTVDSVRACLDDLRRAKKAKRPGMHFQFHQVKDTTELPNSCPRGSLDQFKLALQRQIDNCRKPTQAPVDSIDIAGRHVQRDEWCLCANSQMLALAKTVNDFPSLVNAVKSKFFWYKGEGFPEDQKNKEGKVGWTKGQTQFTAYDSPEFSAFAKPNGDYTYPVYKRPDNLVHLDDKDAENCGYNDVTGKPIKWCLARQNSSGKTTNYVPIPVRADINLGKLPGVQLIGYMKGRDLADLAMEGSGYLNLTDANGVTPPTAVGYESENGQPASALTNTLNCLTPPPANKKQYLDSLKPAELKKLLEYDRSYVFFAKKSPQGSEGIPVTPLHTVACDQQNVPIGMMELFNTVAPAGGPSECKDATLMTICQDGGGLIVGPHFDIYMGEGPDARKASNSVNATGSFYIALPVKGGPAIDGCK